VSKIFLIDGFGSSIREVREQKLPNHYNLEMIICQQTKGFLAVAIKTVFYTYNKQHHPPPNHISIDMPLLHSLKAKMNLYKDIPAYANKAKNEINMIVEITK